MAQFEAAKVIHPVENLLNNTKRVFGRGGLHWARGMFRDVVLRSRGQHKKKTEVLCTLGGIRVALGVNATHNHWNMTNDQYSLYVETLRAFIKHGLGRNSVDCRFSVRKVPVEVAAIDQLEEEIIRWNDSSRTNWERVRGAINKTISAVRKG